MNAADFIASGILQDYCLGLLTNEEEITVESMCNTYPEVAAALQLMRQAFDKYCGGDHLLGREELRKAIWQHLKKENR